MPEEIAQTTVVAAVVRNEKGQVLISSRPEGKHFAGYWEFPGGKQEVGESLYQTLKRELDEELNIHILKARPWLSLTVLREQKNFILHFWQVNAQDWQGEIQAKEKQQWCWQNPQHITVSPVLPNNQPILQALNIPQLLSGSLNYLLYQPDGKAYAAHIHADTGNHLPCFSDFSDLSSSANQWTFCVVHNAEQLSQVQDMKAIFWAISNANFPALCTHLQQGCSVPILAINATAEQRHRLYQLGIHGFIDSQDFIGAKYT